MTVATLGFAIDSAPLTKATGAMDAMRNAAGRLSQSVNASMGSVTGVFRNASASMGRFIAESSRMAGGASLLFKNLSYQMNQVGQMGAVTGNYLQAMLVQIPDILASFGSIWLVLAGGALAVAGSLFMAQNSVKEADKTAKEFEGTLNRIKDVAPEVGAAIDKALKGTVTQGSVFADLAQGARDFQSQASAAIAQASADIANMQTPGESRNWAVGYNNLEMTKLKIGEIGTALDNGSMSAQEALTQLNAMATANTTPPSLYTTIDALRTVLKTAVAAQAAMSAMSGEAAKTSRVGATPESLVVDKASQLSANTNVMARMGMFDTSRLAEDLKTQAKGLNEVAKAAAGAAKVDPYANIIDGADRTIASLQSQVAALGMTEQAASALKRTQDMLNQADQAGVTLSQAQVDQLRAKAELMASLEAQVKTYNENTQLATSATTGFLSTLRQGLVNGEGWWQSLGNAALSVLDKIASAIETQIANQLVGSLFAAPSIGSSPLGGLLGANANGTDGWRGGPTVVGERGPEIVNLPRGSQVIPNHKASGGGGGSQGVKVDVGVSVDNNGNLQAYVKNVANASAGSAARAVVSEYDKKALPKRMRQIAADPRKVG